MQPTLTRGALGKIKSGKDIEQPVFEFLGYMKLTSSAGDRYRLLLSDGLECDSFVMLAIHLNQLITNQLLSANSVIRINRYTISVARCEQSQRPVIVILDADVLVPGHQVGKALGPVDAANAARARGAGWDNTRQATSAAAPPTPRANQQVAPSASARPGNTPAKLSDLLSSGGEGGITTTPIAALSPMPYRGSWIIKARVTNKTSILKWSNEGGEGKLFNMDLLDASGEIRCTAYREQCDKFHGTIQVGKVYYVARGLLYRADKRFNKLKHDYEITIGPDAEIVLCNEQGREIPRVEFNFISVAEIKRKQEDELIDLVGVVKVCSDVQTVKQGNTGRDLKKRDLGVVDENNEMINLTLWGRQALEFKNENYPVVAMKGVKIGRFLGAKNLSMQATSLFHVNPDLPEAHRLRKSFATLESRSTSRFLAE